MPDSLPAPPDLDVLAARDAARLFRLALARGMPEGAAWEEAMILLRGRHPAWPLPLVEAEAARVVAVLIRREDVDAPAAGTEAGARRVPPRPLLLALSNPCQAETAEEEGAEEAAGRAAPSRPAGAVRLPRAAARPLFPVPARRAMAQAAG